MSTDAPLGHAHDVPPSCPSPLEASRQSVTRTGHCQATAVVELAGGTRRAVLGRLAVGWERERLWQRWRELDKNLDSYAARRPRETAVVVLEPRIAAG